MEPRRYNLFPQEQNKRQYPRVRWSDSVEMFADSEMDLSAGSLSCDLSRGGVRVRTARFLPVNSLIHMRVKLSSGKVLNCAGRVMWVTRIAHAEDDQYHLGISFDESSIDLEGLSDLNQTVAMLS